MAIGAVMEDKTDRQKRIEELAQENKERVDIPVGAPPTEARLQRMNELMQQMAPSYRRRWCDPGEGCGCMGCANMAGGLAAKGYTMADFDAWQ